MLATGEAGVKRLARTVDGAVSRVAALLLDHVDSSVEEAAFQLGETLGLARCSAWMAPLTLQVLPLCSLPCQRHHPNSQTSNIDTSWLHPFQVFLCETMSTHL